MKINGNEYRIKKMNAVETLALRTQFSFETTEQTINCYNSILERIEVNVKNNDWLPVKEKDKDIYYPANIENDIDTIDQLIVFFMQFIKEVFQKSNASKIEQE